MVCTEYPPMQGGVGRYTHNLVKSLRSNNLDVIVVSSSDGSGDYSGILPCNKRNSEVLLKLVKKINPDMCRIAYSIVTHSPSETW